MNPFQECFQVDNTQKKTICHLDSISYRDCLRLLRDSNDLIYLILETYKKSPLLDVTFSKSAVK